MGTLRQRWSGGAGCNTPVIQHPRRPGRVDPVYGEAGLSVKGRLPVFQPRSGSVDSCSGSNRKAQFQEQTTLPQVPASIRSKPFWKSSIAIWWVSTFCSGKPVSTIWVILYQVSYILRP